ncbi:hypothetical protein [Yersinia ruckeri]|uniref:hypothetical protein n=1 Tax=Yersinia ruckeri TaxID=29486 RepID=UPI0020BE8013|nr:hypothetical protein [Yersinia ruckeri]EKN4181318.1 hypothetical protein [Yersinia ruckeri]MCK8554006.1 hypothetical protein [Yersinia ruckeri]
MNNDLTEQERLDFVMQLEIPDRFPFRAHYNSTINKAEEGAEIAKSSVISFVSGLSTQNREDVQNSTLLMQLNSDKKFNPQTQKEEWFKNYSDGLSKLGWGRVASTFQKYSPNNTNVTMDQVILEIIATVVNPSSALYDIVATTFNAMRSDSNKSALNLFDNSSTSNGSGSFQILPVAQDSDGNAIMVMTCINAKTIQQEGSFLFWHWVTSSSELYRAAQQTVLNTQVYSRVRAAVLDKLGKSAEDFVEDLDI